MSRPCLSNVRITLYIKPETLEKLRALQKMRALKTPGQAVDALAESAQKEETTP